MPPLPPVKMSFYLTFENFCAYCRALSAEQRAELVRILIEADEVSSSPVATGTADVEACIGG
jgi:hypothetical protein